MTIVSNDKFEVFDLFLIALRTAGSDIEIKGPGPDGSKKARYATRRECKELLPLLRANPMMAIVSEWEDNPGSAAWLAMGKDAQGGAVSISLGSKTTLAEARLIKASGAPEPEDLPESSGGPWEYEAAEIAADRLQAAIRTYPGLSRCESKSDGENLTEYVAWTTPEQLPATLHVFANHESVIIIPGVGQNKPLSELIADHAVKHARH